jgi:predicted MPP superfamily phosphohydrolase
MAARVLLGCAMWSSVRAGQIVYPWRATTAIVKAGQTFEIWFKADPGQEVTAARLESPYKKLNAGIRGMGRTEWVYDSQSGETCNRKLTVAVPDDAPADRYALVLTTSQGEEKSPGSVKVVREFKTEYHIMHISDVHAYQNTKLYGEVPRFKVSLLADIANIIDPEIVFFTGDHMYFPDGGRITRYYEGGDKLYGREMMGLHDFHGATFEVVGNHDYQTEKTPGEEPKRIEKIRHWNRNFGLQAYNFTYGDGRFMVVNNAMGDYRNQTDEAVAWINRSGAGNFRLGAFHIRGLAEPFHAALKGNHTPLTVCLAGHEHNKASGNPWPVNGDPVIYIASAIRDYMDFNLFKVNAATGACAPVSGRDGRVFPLENPPSHTATDPAKYHPRLTLSFDHANTGAATTGSATITNRLDFGIAAARVRFIMKQGGVYAVSAPAVITQQFDGDGGTGRIVDVRVDVAANSTGRIGIALTTPGSR